MQLFGQGTFGNVVSSNIVGGNPSATRAIVITALGGTDLYSAANRQDDGILITNATGNQVTGNVVLANQDGIRITGALASGNVVAGNQVGPTAQADGSTLVDRLGNFFGIDVEGAPSNNITGNVVSRNISVGIELKGASASGNVVQRNIVAANGAFGSRAIDGANPRSTIVTLTQAVPTALVFGVGIYLEEARDNIVGSTPGGRRGTPETRADGNTIRDNALVDLYLFQGATGNQIRSNTIEGGFRSGGTGLGEYGVFLFNSAGNLSGVSRQGKFANQIRFHRIAQFREFTGPVSNKPHHGAGPAARTARERPGHSGGSTLIGCWVLGIMEGRSEIGDRR